MDDCSGSMHVACRHEAASSLLATVSFCLAVQGGKDEATQSQMLPDGNRERHKQNPNTVMFFLYGGIW